MEFPWGTSLIFEGSCGKFHWTKCRGTAHLQSGYQIVRLPSGKGFYRGTSA